MIPWITADQVAAAMTASEAIDAFRSTLQNGFDPENDLPRTVTDVRSGGLLLMPSDVGGYTGVKVASVSPSNPERSLPRIQGLYLLLDADTLTPIAVIDGAAITTIRTPAVAIVAVADVLRDRFADPVSVLLFGVGPQGRGLVAALETVSEVADVTVAVRSPGRSSEVAADLESRGIGCREVATATPDCDAAVSDADVVITATTSSDPVFRGANVDPRTVVIAVGSHEPDVRELDTDLIGRSHMIVESKISAMEECGDIILAARDGAVDADALIPMRDVVTGRTRPGADRPVVFKGSGMSFEDLIVASSVYERAAKPGDE